MFSVSFWKCSEMKPISGWLNWRKVRFVFISFLFQPQFVLILQRQRGKIGVRQGKASFRPISEGDGNVPRAQSKTILFLLVFSASSQLLKEIDVLEIQFQIERSCRESAEELAVKVCVVLFRVIVSFPFVLCLFSLRLLSSSFTLHSRFPISADDQGKQSPEEDEPKVDASTADAAGGHFDSDL